MEECLDFKPPKKKMSNKKIGIIVVLCIVGFYVLLFSLIAGISEINSTLNEVEFSNLSDYEVIFDISNHYKKMEYTKMDTFGTKTYNSALLFVPREKPDQLLEFYYHAYKRSKRIDCKFYFAYKLDHDAYEAKKNEIYNYKITIDGQSHELIKNDNAFYYPAVIISYRFDGSEYILFDNDNDVIIHVFNHYDSDSYYDSYSSMQRYASYNVSLKNSDSYDDIVYPYLVAEGVPIVNGKGYIFNKYGCFKKEKGEYLYSYNFYAFVKDDEYQYYNDFEYAK